MKNKILMVLLALIVVFSAIFAYTVYRDSVDDSKSYTADDASADEITDEIDQSFIDENNDVEIGDMV